MNSRSIECLQQRSVHLKGEIAEIQDELHQVERELVRDLEDLCMSDLLSLSSLKEKTKFITQGSFDNKSSLCLHYVCGNKNVTIEIVEHLLDCSFPDGPYHSQVVNGSEIYPLHLACANEHCPSPVIDLIFKRSSGSNIFKRFETSSLLTSQLKKLGLVGNGVCPNSMMNVQGTPLSYYLSRDPSRIDPDIVIKLVNAYPKALITPLPAQDNVFYMPLYAFLLRHDFKCIGILIEASRFLTSRRCPLFNNNGATFLHQACLDKRISLQLVQFLLEAWPRDAGQTDQYGNCPLHTFCVKQWVDGEPELEILSLLVKSCPDALRWRNVHGYLPIHLAASTKSPAFCKLLVDLYPESVMCAAAYGDQLPLHRACRKGNVQAIRYLYELSPDNLYAGGYLPIHLALLNEFSEAVGIEILQYLLQCNPEVASKPVLRVHDDWLGAPKVEGRLALHLACFCYKSLSVLTILFNAYPEAIDTKDGEGRIPSDYFEEGEQKSFLQIQEGHAEKAKDHQFMTTRDCKGRLPLHTALYQGECLGTIKLLVKGNPEALQVPDGSGLYPLHIACKVGSLEIVQFVLKVGLGLGLVPHA